MCLPLPSWLSPIKVPPETQPLVPLCTWKGQHSGLHVIPKVSLWPPWDVWVSAVAECSANSWEPARSTVTHGFLWDRHQMGCRSRGGINASASKKFFGGSPAKTPSMFQEVLRQRHPWRFTASFSSSSSSFLRLSPWTYYVRTPPITDPQVLHPDLLSELYWGEWISLV